MKQGPSATVLVVDDVAANREAVRELLDVDGYRLVEASDGVSALKLAAETPPDVVLLDVMMPGMDGYEVCRRLRADKRLAEVPVIVVTALGDSASRLAAIQAGADDFVTKPFSGVELRARVRTITRLNRYRLLHEMQSALHESERHFRVLFELGPVAIYSCDAGGIIQSFNRRAATLWGREPQLDDSANRVCGSHRLLLPDGTHVPHEHSAMAGVLSGKVDAVEGMEIVIERPDTSRIDVAMSIVPLKNDRGEITGAISSFYDITERKRAEAGLRESDERYQKMLMLSPDGIFVHVEGIITFATPAFCQLMGVIGPSQLVGRPIATVIHPNHDASVLDPQLTALPGHQVSRTEMKFIRLDGTTVDVEAASIAFEMRGHKEVQVIARDITERKAAEVVLRASEQWLRAVFEQAAVGVAQTDVTTGRFMRVNQRFCDIVGYTAAECMTLAFNDITHEQDRALGLENSTRLRVGSIRQFGQEKRYVRKDGSIVWVDIAVSSIGPAGSGAISFVGFVLDITERKQAHEQVLRTQRLDNLGMLAAGIAHDFNNALAPIIMSGPLLRDYLSGDNKVHRSGDDPKVDFKSMRKSDVNPGAQHLLNVVEGCAERGAGLVRQLLSFARGASGERQLLQARHVLREVGDLAEVTFPKSIRIKMVLPADLWPVQANATQIHQVFLNLCVNARDAMPQGGNITLTASNLTLDSVTAAELPDARIGDFLAVEVQDTGEGIPAEVLTRIWDPFFTTKGEGKGTGLGLSTVRGIVQQHDGFVTVQTRVGRGTAFTVYLPAAPSARADDASKIHLRPARGQGELILVVDDEKNVCQLAAQVLSGYGYRTITACDGADAIAVFAPRAAEVQLLLTDLQMPMLGGPALATALRRLRPNLPIIAMSGVESRNSNTAHKEFTTAYIAKPFQTETLLSIVRETLDAASPAAPVLAAN
jgi:two-component system cell cycle sensor histidine kinase/response regulator CckA